MGRPGWGTADSNRVLAPNRPGEKRGGVFSKQNDALELLNLTKQPDSQLRNWNLDQKKKKKKKDRAQCIYTGRRSNLTTEP